MEPDIKARFNQGILAKISEKYGTTPAELTELGGFESFIYEYKQGGQSYILRISHSERRSEAMIRGEVDWINYLVKGGAGASQVIDSRNGHLVEMADDGHGEIFIGTVFKKAPGVPPHEFGWSDRLYETYGKILGRLHCLTKGYTPTDSLAFRPQWDDPLMLIDESWLPESEKVIYQQYQKILEICSSLPLTRDEYGLIHFDAHGGNFSVAEDGSIHLFDFDDCHYSWFANDIAIVLFYVVMGKEEQAAFTENFMKHFIRGYQTENKFKPEWLDLFPIFLKMRELDLTAIIHRSFDLETTDDKWVLWFMDGRKEKIENDVPYVDYDFSRLLAFI